MQNIPLTELGLVFLPAALLITVIHRWRLKAWTALYANARMLLQLLLVGYLLTYVFESEAPLLVLFLVSMMIGVSSWIALRSLETKSVSSYLMILTAIGIPGLLLLGLVTELVLDMPNWFAPRIVIPIAGMIFANSMNTVSLAAERFESEFRRGESYGDARRTALEAALIPQINSLFAVGLVALPGMMTGQILSGVDPLIAVRYQIMVMWMIFASGGLAAVLYLKFQQHRAGLWQGNG